MRPRERKEKKERKGEDVSERREEEVGRTCW